MTEAERKAKCERIAHEVKALADTYHGRLRELEIGGYSVEVKTFRPSDTNVIVRHYTGAASDPKTRVNPFRIEQD